MSEKTNKEIENIVHTTLLYDFYSPILTEKQRQYIEMYFMQDMSLGEIAAEYGVTRQAAGILISRAEKKMRELDKKLKLIEKHINTENSLQRLITNIDNICTEPSLDTQIKLRLKNLINDTCSLIEHI